MKFVKDAETELRQNTANGSAAQAANLKIAKYRLKKTNQNARKKYQNASSKFQNASWK